MKLAIDACSAINLVNGSVLKTVLSLPDYEFFVGQLVLEECDGQSERRSILESAIEEGLITEIDEDELSGELFESLTNEFGMGAGETECLTFAEQHGEGVVTDDGRARSVSTQRFGEHRLFGSIRLLKLCVENGLLQPAEGPQIVKQMIASGGYLPQVPDDYFGD